MTWQKTMAALALTEAHFDAMKNRLIDRMGWRDPLQIVAYRGYGTAQAVTVRGRVWKIRGCLRPRTTTRCGPIWPIWPGALPAMRCPMPRCG